MELYEIEMAYTEEIYTSIGLVEDVNRFVRYNANKGLMNLGLEPKFEEEINNRFKWFTYRYENHDFFSVKGNGYVKATNVEKLADDDFVFNF